MQATSRKPQGERIAHSLTLDYWQLKQAMTQLLAKDFSFVRRRRNRELCANFFDRWGTDRVDSFSGFSGNQLREWLNRGYQTKALSNLTPESPPIRKRRKVIYSDEGELQVDLALSGFDYPFIDWTRRESMPGLALNVEFSFQAGVPASVILEYESWLAKTAFTLETEGIDLEVSIFYKSRGIFAHRRDDRTMTRVRVKKENEATDFASWSVMFSPAGFRGMLFLSCVLTGDSANEDTSSGLGHGVDQGDWRLEFDNETRTLEVRCPWVPSNFPAEKMTEQLREILHRFH